MFGLVCIVERGLCNFGFYEELWFGERVGGDMRGFELYEVFVD